MIIKVKINDIDYPNYSFFEVEESFDFPFHVRLGLVPTATMPLTDMDNFLHLAAIITYEPDEGDLNRFSWVPPFSSYHGYVESERRQLDMDQKLSLVVLDIYHPLHWLNRSCHFRIFHEKTLADIIDEIFTPYQSTWQDFNITSYEYTDDLRDFAIPYCTQYQETDLHFFLRLCETYGVRMTLHDGIIRLTSVLGPQPEGDPFPIPPIAKVQISSQSTSLSRTVKHRNIECTSLTEELATETTPVTSTTAMTIEGEDPYWVDLYEPNINRAKLKVSARGLDLQYQEYTVEINNKQTLNNQPLAGVRVGDQLSYGNIPIYVQRVKCRTTGVNNSGETQGYEITVWGREKQCNYVMPQRHRKPQVHSFLRALVIEPKQPSGGDDELLGRIKVKFLWQEEEAPTCWVRLAMPYAGKTHGFYVMPEIGDEVLIGFEGGDIDRPFCLGSVFNKDAKVLPTLSKAEQMETIHMRTPQNVFLKFHEVPNGSQTATMAVTGVSILSMDNKPSVNITTTGVMNITTKKDYTHKTDTIITLDSGNGSSKIVLEPGGNLSITNTAVGTFSSTGNQTISSTGGSQTISASTKQDITAGAAQTVKSTGGLTTIDGASGVDVKGHAKVDIAGTTTKITSGGATVTLASAKVTIQGGPIEITGGDVTISGGAIKISGSSVKVTGSGGIDLN